MGRSKVPFADLDKCHRNKGKDVRITLASGLVLEGTIWKVLRSKGRGLDPSLHIKIWDGGLAGKNRHGRPSGMVQPLRASSIVKFEYLWEEAIDVFQSGEECPSN